MRRKQKEKIQAQSDSVMHISIASSPGWVLATLNAMEDSKMIPSFILEILQPLHSAGSEFTFSSSSNLISVAPSTASPPIRYLFKTSPAPAIQLVGEAESLVRADEASEGVCPKLLGRGEMDEGKTMWMLTVWQDLSRLSTTEHFQELATLLAKQHLAQPPAPWDKQFGFPVPTCCGATQLDNVPLDGEQAEDWAAFFAHKRLHPLLKGIGDQGLLNTGRWVMELVVPTLLGKLKISPSLLHGDLWSGNVGLSRTTSSAVTFDPASYYGHSEADLGIARMFGGFPPSFYEHYHTLVPKSEPVEEYEQRAKLYECWHHLNHALMFGGGSYKKGTEQMMEELIDWCIARIPRDENARRPRIVVDS